MQQVVSVPGPVCWCKCSLGQIFINNKGCFMLSVCKEAREMRLFYGLCLWTLLSSVCLIFAKDDPVVETGLGKVKGSILKTVKGREFSAFRGIRYAKAPVGELRFKAPVAVTSWGDSVLDGTKEGHICPQVRFPENLVSEDCLFLNVYTRDLKGNATVLVFIHGGANLWGSSVSGTEAVFIMDHDIVLVSMNYRLGALGFLTTGTKEAPGNYGYLDQLMALQWVHDHVSRFGGNPNSVTVFGLSAGAMAITLHLASPLSKGLFHRAIVMSGSMTCHKQFDNVAVTRTLAKHLSCATYNLTEVVDCLRKVSWQSISEVLSSWEPYGVLKFIWMHEIDGHFLQDTLTNVFADGSFNKVPIVTGITKDEFSYLVNDFDEGLLIDIDSNFEKYAPEFFSFEIDSEESAKKKSNRIKHFYFSDNIYKQTSNFGKIFADAMIGHGVYRLMELARKHVDVYYYRDDYQGQHGLKQDSIGVLSGVMHGDDLQYVFNRSYFNGHIELGDPDWFMVERMTKWWTSFARDGVPSEVDGVKWLPSNSSSVFTMYSDKALKIVEGRSYYYDRYSEWDSMFPVRSSAEAVKVAWILTAGAVALHVCAKSVL